MTLLTGKVLSVETRNLAEPAIADAAIGATTIYVNDAATFDENGGVVVVGGAQLAYSAIDADLDTITLADPLAVAVAEQDPIEVYPATPIKTATISLGGDGDPLPATVPHALLDKFPDGLRSDETAESVIVEQRGTYEYVVADAIAEPLTQTSLDFEAGDIGYGLTAAGQQMQDLAVLGNLGAEAGSFSALSLGGQDLATELDSKPGGVRAFARLTNTLHAGPTSGTTEIVVLELAAGDVSSDHLYSINASGLLQGLGGSASGDQYEVQLRYTLDGSQPTITSTILPGAADRVTLGPATNLSSTFRLVPNFQPPTTGNLRIGLTLRRMGGVGTAYIYLASLPYEFQWSISEAGAVGAFASTGILSQRAKSDGSGPDNPPITQFVKTFEATWAQSYMPGGDAYANNGTSDTLWAGYDSSLGAPVAAYDYPDLSLIGFDYTAIMAALSSASTMQKCEVLYRGRWRKVSTGLDIKFLTHDYSAWPGNFIDAYNVPSIPNTHLTFLSNTALNIANGTNYATDLGATVGNQFKAGTRRGFGIIGQDLGDDARGYIYGVGATYKPKIRFTYLGTG